MRLNKIRAALWVTSISMMMIFSSLSEVNAVVSSQSGDLVSHRAVYDMSLNKAKSGSGLVGILGRMVFEFSGSSCEGYTLNMRLVTQMTDRQGNLTLSDLRSSSWEQAEGKRFRFNSSQYLNQQLKEITSGDASRPDLEGSVKVEIKKPTKTELQLPPKISFPTQHSRGLLNAAMHGKKIFQADIYDGSEKGEKIYSTTAIIGSPFPAGSNKKFKKIEDDDHLNKLISWPVSISYFPPKSRGEVIPDYQISFRLFSNGVSRKLVIDYGEFSLNGTLSSIKFLESSSCQ